MEHGATRTLELITPRSLVATSDGAYYIVSKETETTGYEGGCTTTVKGAGRP